MTSSNKARRYLQHQKQQFFESNNGHQSAAELLIIDPTLAVTNMRKFRGRTQQQTSATASIPQICVDNEKLKEDENGHVAILDEFDEVLENELKRSSVLRTSSLHQKDSKGPMKIPVNQQRSFSFALSSSTNLDGKQHDEEEEVDNYDESVNLSSSSKMTSSKRSATVKASLSKETFSRLLHSLAFRSGNHTTSKLTATQTIEASTQHPCLACQNPSNLDFLPKYKKRPSIFGVLVSKLNTNTTTTTTGTNETPHTRCPVCKRRLSKSIFYNPLPPNTDDDNQQLSPSTQNVSLSSLASSKLSPDQAQLLLHTKRRRSLPSLLHSLFDFDHHDKRRLDSTQIQHRPSISSIFTHTLLDSITREQHQQQSSIAIVKQTSPVSHSSNSLTESDDSEENNNNNMDKSFKRPSITYDDSFQLTEKLQLRIEPDGIAELSHDILQEKEISAHELNEMNANEPPIENPTNQLFLHPPEEKTRSLLVNVFRTRRSHVALGSNETSMAGKQFSVSVINLATSISSNRIHQQTSATNESTQLKHALSEENLTTTDGTYIYFVNVNGQNFKERLKYSNTSENTTLREILLKLFEKHHFNIETCNICLKSAPTLPLSLDQPVKHLLLDDLIVTEKEHGLPTPSHIHNRALAKTSAGKERNEKRNSTGSTALSSTSKSASATSKRFSTQCMVSDNDDIIPPTNSNYSSELKSTNSRAGKTNRSGGLFTGSIFTRDVNDERPESNLAFVRRKCDEWLTRGLPKLAQLQNYQFPFDEHDLKIDKEWQPFLNEQARSNMSESIKLQQEAIYEMLVTEVSYIRQIFTMTDIFMTSVMILKSSQRDGLLNDIDMEKLFSNIQDVLNANLFFWKDILFPIKSKLEQTGCAMNPSNLKQGFLKFDVYFKSYIHYILDQKTSAEYFKQKFAKDDLFQYLITWIEANFTNRLSFPDLTIKPLQRLTQYKLLLEAIQKRTQDSQQLNDLSEMIQKVATFVNRVNSKLHSQEQEERVRQISERIGPFEYVSAPPELTSILQEYHRDSSSHRLDLLRDIPLFVRGYRRQIIQQGPMKMKDSKNSQDVYCYLFTDMFLITKGGKRSGTTSSSSSTSASTTSISTDGQLSRSALATLNKILKPPIRIDRMDVREYDRRGGSSSSSTEPNTASFVAIVFSEYNLIECGYLFQTNLSKQWIENIRAAKANFQLLLEDSKARLQNAHHHHSNTSLNPPQPPPAPATPQAPASASSSNNPTPSTMHQSLPSLSSASEISSDLSSVIKLDDISVDSSCTDEPMVSPSMESNRRSSKVESDVFKSVEQTRRNSRSDHKNFGRYFTADGTHVSNPSSASSLVNPSSVKSTPSTAIIKRMSWNSEHIEKIDPTTSANNELSNTNSFRSVHSSSGVSSTGSFLFSADEEPSITTTTTTSSSIPASLPSTINRNDDLTDELDEFDGKSSSSTVVGTDDREHSSNSIASPLQNSNELINSDLMDNTNNRLSTASTSTLTPSSNHPSVNTSPELSLRRTIASVRKRNQAHTHHRSGGQSHPFRRHRIFDENDLRSSTHTIVYDSSKTIPNSTINSLRRTVLPTDETNLILSSLGGSGNESDYDNNQSNNDYSNLSKYISSTRSNKLPVNDFHPSDDLQSLEAHYLGDQNETILNNNLNFHHPVINHHEHDDENTEAHVDLSDDNDDDVDADENTINIPQSDNILISSANSLQSAANQRTNNRTSPKSQASTSNLDDSAPANYTTYRKDPLATRKLLDIRSHLLLNTTLDATEV